MSKSAADQKKQSTLFEIVRRADGTFDLFVDRKLDQTATSERWLPEWLCVRFGFCGEEYDSILRQVRESGKATISF